MKNMVHHEIVYVTPEMAEQWLKRNVSNRPLRQKRVDEIAELMREGRWGLGQDAIAFDTLNRLINGQHRLHAVIKSGTTQPFLVIRGLSPESFQFMDVGARRTGADTLHLVGHENYTALAAVARAAVLFSKTGGVRAIMQGGKVHNDELIAAVEQFPETKESVKFALRWSSNFKGWMSPSRIAFLHFLYKRDYGHLSDEFVEGLATGANLSAESPILLARNRLMGRSEVDKLTREVAFALLVLAFNHHVNGRTIKLLRWSPGQGQSYPVPDVTPLEFKGVTG